MVPDLLFLKVSSKFKHQLEISCTCRLGDSFSIYLDHLDVCQLSFSLCVSIVSWISLLLFCPFTIYQLYEDKILNGWFHYVHYIYGLFLCCVCVLRAPLHDFYCFFTSRHVGSTVFNLMGVPFPLGSDQFPYYYVTYQMLICRKCFFLCLACVFSLVLSLFIAASWFIWLNCFGPSCCSLALLNCNSSIA